MKSGSARWLVYGIACAVAALIPAVALAAECPSACATVAAGQTHCFDALRTACKVPGAASDATSLLCKAEERGAEGMCAADARLREPCGAVGWATDACRAVQKRAAVCAVYETDPVCAALPDDREKCAKEKALAATSPLPIEPDTFLLGVQASESAQLRIPRLDGIPSTVFSNLVGLGLVFQKEHVEVTALAHFVYSSSSADVQGSGPVQSRHADGSGGEGGVRVAVGWFDAQSGGFYFSVYPAVSSWHLNATFDPKTSYSASVTELSTDFGFGYKLRLSDRLRLDFMASAVHIAARPEAQSILTITSYPTIGVGLDALFRP